MQDRFDRLIVLLPLCDYPFVIYRHDLYEL
jgi:hypothetical protein